MYLACAVIGVGGRGDIKHAFKWLYTAPLHADA